MKTLNRKVKIPYYLQELHGEEAMISDLVLTYYAALAVTSLVIFQVWNIPVSILKIIVLCLLTFDLSGGVVANFSHATSIYYAAHAARRRVFAVFHIVQPLVIIWIFPAEWICIGVIASYSIISMIIVGSIRENTKRRVPAAVLALIGLSMVFLLPFQRKVLLFILLLYIIKLVLAFPVDWAEKQRTDNVY